ncbi:MAG: hypothetical protein AB7U20_07885 [Planctomycetaceae bacterium]
MHRDRLLRDRYANDKGSAIELLSVGESPRDQSLDPADHGAMAGLCLMILRNRKSIISANGQF